MIKFAIFTIFTIASVRSASLRLGGCPPKPPTVSDFNPTPVNDKFRLYHHCIIFQFYIFCSILVCGTNMKVCQHFLPLLALHALEPHMETTVREMSTKIICSKLYFNFYYCRRWNSIRKKCRCFSSWKI